MIDITGQLDAIEREVTRRQGPSGEEVCVRIRRSYEATIADVWDALTDPDRMKRWFLPITGELRVGGAFQLEGNAGGDILECEPPHRFKVTFGGPTSLVDLRLSSQDQGRTTLEMVHSVPIEIAQSGAGALFVGPGWDAGLVALDRFLQDGGGIAPSPPESGDLSRRSVDFWVTAVGVSATATDEEIETVRQMALAQFAPADEATEPSQDPDS